MSKVLILNGSPRVNGNTSIAIREMERMGQMAITNLERAMNALITLEESDIKEVYEVEKQIDYLNREITSYLVKINETTLPVDDAKSIGGLFHIVNDIERIGDHASDIAELIQQMDHKQLERYSGHLQPMIAASREMVHEAVSAFVARDQKKANDVIASDDIIDKLFDKVKNDIVIHIKEDRSDAIESLDALMLAKYLERIGDHAVNICEWEIFRETGTIQNTKVF